MKKLFLLLIIGLIFTTSFASDVFVQNDVKYISKERAEAIWDVEIELKERSGVIKIVCNDKNTIAYMQIGNNIMQIGKQYNSFFINTDGFKLKGNKKITAPPIMLDEKIYLPSDVIYEIVHAENEYDVIVIGSDPEGISAAVAAARMGAKVLLVGEESSLGGLLTHGMLNTLDMNYSNAGVLLTQGIFEEFYNDIGNKVSFDIKKAEKAFEQLINDEKNITYKANMKYVSPILEDKKIKGINVRFGTASEEYFAKNIIDATRDGDICVLAGAPYNIGMEDLNIKDTFMAVTLVFKVSGVDWNELGEDIKRYQDETGDMVSGINDSTAWAFGKWCYNNYTPIYSNMKLRGLNIGRQDDNTILINALQILGVDGLDAEARETAKRQGAKELENVVKYLKTKLNSFENATLVDVADDLYIRETRHIKGEYIVKASDLLEGVVFEDSIACGSYPIDIQSTSIENNGFVIGVPDFYTIPFRSSIPLEVDNLFVVGKAASYSSAAAGSVRVVPVGMVVGESCGIASVYSIMNDITPREMARNSIIMEQLKQILNEEDIYIPKYKEAIPIVESPYYQSFLKLLNLGIIGGGYENDFKLKDEAKVNEFYKIIIKVMQRSGVKSNYDEMEDMLDKYNVENDLTKETAISIMREISPKETDEDKIFETIQEDINNGQTINKEIMYEIICNFVENSF